MEEVQSSLFDLKPLTKPEYEKGMSLRQRWWAFHCANPHIYNVLRSMALNLKEKGYQRCSIGLLWERLRWESFIQTQGEGEYRLSNNHRSFYSRFLMAREPLLKGFFQVKHQPSQDED